MPSDEHVLDEVLSRLAALEGELKGLRAELAGEVRTRRLVVIDETGLERVVASGNRSTGSVQVRTAQDAQATTGVELYATDDSGDATAEVGVLFLRGGNVAAQWRAEYHHSRLGLAGEPPHQLGGVDAQTVTPLAETPRGCSSKFPTWVCPDSRCRLPS